MVTCPGVPLSMTHPWYVSLTMDNGHSMCYVEVVLIVNFYRPIWDTEFVGWLADNEIKWGQEPQLHDA